MRCGATMTTSDDASATAAPLQTNTAGWLAAIGGKEEEEKAATQPQPVSPTFALPRGLTVSENRDVRWHACMANTSCRLQKQHPPLCARYEHSQARRRNATCSGRMDPLLRAAAMANSIVRLCVSLPLSSCYAHYARDSLGTAMEMGMKKTLKGKELI